MEVEFNFRRERSRLFGKILRPVAKVILIHKQQVVPQIFYVDSGADITLIPRSVGEVLRFDNPLSDEIFDITGIGEKGVPVVLRKVKIQLGEFRKTVNIGWALIEDVPLLLGREEFFKYFNIIFAKNRKTIFQKA